MLKITSRNEKLNRRMAQKEITHLLHKIFCCFFVFPNKGKRLKSAAHFQSFSPSKKLFLSALKQKNKASWQRYFRHWQSKLLFHFSFTKARTICFLTGRSRSVYRAFRLSRLKIRAYAAAGHFIGLSKASW